MSATCLKKHTNVALFCCTLSVYTFFIHYEIVFYSYHSAISDKSNLISFKLIHKSSEAFVYSTIYPNFTALFILKQYQMEAKFSISEVAGTSWKFTKSQIWVLAGMFLAYCVVTGILNLITSSSYVLNLLVQLIIGSLFTLGFIRNMFQTMDGEEPQFSAYGQEARKFLHYLVANILYSIIVCIGIVLLIIPGIYLAIRLQFFQQYIVSEERCSAIDALKKSWELTQGQAMPLFLLALVQIGLTLLGLILLVVGLFVAIPLIVMMQCYVFRKLRIES